jgi:hypothetical protein
MTFQLVTTEAGRSAPFQLDKTEEPIREIERSGIATERKGLKVREGH